MRRRIQLLCARVYNALRRLPSREVLDLQAANRDLANHLMEAKARESNARAGYIERCHELMEARQLTGSGPWLAMDGRTQVSESNPIQQSLRESLVASQTLADLELALESIDWRREINFGLLEFSRWGIQQLMLISRLYFLKNPLIQRGINVASHYVFGRGVEVSSPDETANEVLKEFFERNKTTLGQIALTDLERRKYYDGNLFFVFFSDTQDSGQVNIRTFDATEIQDIVTNPDDSDQPWFYRRTWTQRTFDPKTGQTSTGTQQAWYPALGYEPADRQPAINGFPVHWDRPVLHRKCGAVAKWNFGCPLVYAALDWAREAKKFLENCATVRAAQAQYALTFTTKGGQQALQGIKNQFQTSEGPPGSLWDRNPPALQGATFASGPGSTLEPFITRGASNDPEEVRRYVLMVCAVFGFPETFFGDVQTGNLATAQSLDRPTELNFLEKQEAWREDLVTIARYVLRVSAGATGGRLRASMAKANIGNLQIVEGLRVATKTKAGNTAFRMVEAKTKREDRIEVLCNFPAILEGDIPGMVKAVVDAHSTGVVDDKVTAIQLYDLMPDITDGAEIAEDQYPSSTYDPDRTKEPKEESEEPEKKRTTEAVKLARRLVTAVAQESNGHHHA